MFNWSLFNSRKDFYLGAFADSYNFDHDHHHLQVDARNLSRFVEILKFDMGFILLSDIVVLPVSGHPTYVDKYKDVVWDVTYHLFHMDAHQRLQLHLLLKDGESVPTISHWFPAALPLELEVQRRIKGEKQIVERLSLSKPRSNPNLSEPPYLEELSQWYLFDINHPLTKGQWELSVESRQGKILRSHLSNGHWKKDIEERVCQKPFSATSAILDGLSSDKSLMVNLTWAKTIEDYFHIKIPEKAQAIRMIFIELSRIYHHLGVLKNVSMDLDLPDPAQICIEFRDHVKFLVSFYSARRLSLGTAFFGGLSHDLPPGWIQEVTSFMHSLERGLGLFHQMVALHPLARMRLKAGAISAQDALQAAITGPTLRAAGVNFDLRKSRPFYFYQDMCFDVPVGINGDSHDRMLIFFEECRQSIKILNQLIENLPIGEFQSDASLVAVLNSMTISEAQWREAVVGAQRVWSSQYTAIEGANGELGFHLVLHPETSHVYGFKIKSNALMMASTLDQFLHQCPLVDLSPTLSSLDINSSFLDR